MKFYQYLSKPEFRNAHMIAHMHGGRSKQGGSIYRALPQGPLLLLKVSLVAISVVDVIYLMLVFITDKKDVRCI